MSASFGSPTGSGGTSGYSQGGGGQNPLAGAPGGATPDQATGDLNIPFWSLARCKRSYEDYLAAKRLEILEQQEARRYRHGVQWTRTQIDVFNKRKQPVVTYNRVGKKIDGIVGLVERMRADPKAFPRTPRFQAGADLATAALRSCLDTGKWRMKSPKAAATGAVDGIGGLELILEQGQQGYEVGFEAVDIDGFFYDPRSKKEDFSDCRYMGMGKWLDAEMARDMFPKQEGDIDASVGYGYYLTSNSDSDAAWYMAQGQLRSVRMVHIAYIQNQRWCWALFTGQ